VALVQQKAVLQAFHVALVQQKAVLHSLPSGPGATKGRSEQPSTRSGPGATKGHPAQPSMWP